MRDLQEADAKEFATTKHSGQFRRGGAPYITHPERVARSILHHKGNSKNIEHLEAASWLHDTLEDTATTFEEIELEFGPLVASLVKELTSDTAEIARVGKTAYLQHKLKNMTSYALVIKLLDRLDNVSDLSIANLKWSKKYAKQTKDIIDYIQTNRTLTKTHQEIIIKILSALEGFLDD